MSAAPRIALVMVVRNEQRFLRHNLLWHFAIGVEKAWIYLDRCTDDTEGIARSFDNVEVIHRDRTDERYMSQYQVKSIVDGRDAARAEGFDWMLHLDPDEFAMGENPVGAVDSPEQIVEFASLSTLTKRANRRLLGGLLGGVDQIYMRPVEVVPTRLTCEQSFLDLHWFQDGGVIERQLLDPTTRQTRTHARWLGAKRGKSLIRTDVDARPFTHYWKRPNGKKLATANLGRHLHYVVTDWRHWFEKYRKFSEYPAEWQNQKPVEFPKQQWKEAAANFSEAEAQAYFDGEVALAADELALKANTRLGKHLVYDDLVQRLVASLTAARPQNHCPSRPQ